MPGQSWQCRSWKSLYENQPPDHKSHFAMGRDMACKRSESAMAYGRARDVFTRQTSCMEARMRWNEGAEGKSLGPLYFKTVVPVVPTRQGSLDIRSKLQVPRTTASSLIHLSPIPLSPCDDDSVRATPSTHIHMKSEQSLGSRGSGSITSSREDGMRCRWRFPGLER